MGFEKLRYFLEDNHTVRMSSGLFLEEDHPLASLEPGHYLLPPSASRNFPQNKEDRRIVRRYSQDYSLFGTSDEEIFVTDSQIIISSARIGKNLGFRFSDTGDFFGKPFDSALVIDRNSREVRVFHRWNLHLTIPGIVFFMLFMEILINNFDYSKLILFLFSFIFFIIPPFLSKAGYNKPFLNQNSTAFISCFLIYISEAVLCRSLQNSVS